MIGPLIRVNQLSVLEEVPMSSNVTFKQMDAKLTKLAFNQGTWSEMEIEYNKRSSMQVDCMLRAKRRLGTY